MKTFKKYLDKVFSLVLMFVEILLVAMVVIVFTNVVLRYGFSSGIKWGEEIPLVIVIWFTFIAMALGVKQDLHISITIFTSKFNKIGNIILNLIKYTIEFVLGLIMLKYGYLLTINGLRSYLPATHITNAINYLVLPISAIFIILYSGIYLIENIQDLLQKEKKEIIHV